MGREEGDLRDHGMREEWWDHGMRDNGSLLALLLPLLLGSGGGGVV